MGRLMHDAYGIGLAATQVGVMHRLLVYRTELEGSVAALVNPVLEWSSKDKETSEEGCLACPASASRSSGPCTSACRAQDERGKPILVEASRPGGARDPARDGPPRRRPDPRPHLARPAQAGHARAARGSSTTATPPRLAQRLPRHLGVRGGRAAARSPSPRTARSSSSPAPTPSRAAARSSRRRRSRSSRASSGSRSSSPRTCTRPRCCEQIADGAARGAHDVRVRRADQGAAAQRLRDAQRAPVAAAALARRGADRARDHGRRRRDRRDDHARHRGLGLRRRSTRSAASRSTPTTTTARSPRGSSSSARELLVQALDEHPTPGRAGRVATSPTRTRSARASARWTRRRRRSRSSARSARCARTSARGCRCPTARSSA